MIQAEELFNLCYTSARNVIEHIFGMLKYRFQILHLAPEYSMDIQACIPAALAAIHNFIPGHEVDDKVVWVGGDDPRKAGLDDGEEEQYPGWNEEEPSQRRDNIASAMWADYQAELARRVVAGQVA